jgi:hypothetical protein
VHCDRVFIDAERAVSGQNDTRMPIAHGSVPAIPAGANRDNPDAWIIF